MLKKRIVTALMLALPLMAGAQTEWDLLENEDAAQEQAGDNSSKKKEKKTVDPKYLEGAVPEEDGNVVFRTVIDAPGKSADQVYKIVKDYMVKMTKQSNQLDQSRIVASDSLSHSICGNYQEWLTFKSTSLVLDQTKFFYNLMADCSDGKAEITLCRIFYLYDEERDAQTYRAEEWITDEYALTKNKTKLSRVSGKFRRKTIDRKDYLFNKFAELLNQ